MTDVSASERPPSDRISNDEVRGAVKHFEQAHPGDQFLYVTSPGRVDYYVFNSGRYTLKQLLSSPLT